MFYSLDKRGKRIASLIITPVVYIFCCVISGFVLRPAFSLTGIWAIVVHLWYLKLAAALLAAWGLVYARDNSLAFEAEKVGHGQHGDSEFMGVAEANKAYPRIAIGAEKEPGLLVGVDDHHWRVDTSDQNLILLAPPGGGKTKCNFIPTVYYNAQVNRNTGGKGASMIIVDIKGEMYNACSQFLQDAGYRVALLDFRQPYHSNRYNLLYKINREIDAYKTAIDLTERASYYGRAERYAKVLASSLVGEKKISDASESGTYFHDTTQGLLTGLILLVSEYSRPEERHILSVFEMIQACTESAESMKELLNAVDNQRIRKYTTAALSADVRTVSNVISTALSKLTKFIDAELEQMICNHDAALGDVDFIDYPTAIFLICPDENSTRHFFASLFIRFFANELIDQAELQHGGFLPRQVLFFLDEFGNMPAIDDVDMLFSAIRGRSVKGNRIIISVQSLAQLKKHYSKDLSEIIEDNNQMLMFTFQSPLAYDTCHKLSQMLGNQTILTGSVNTNSRNWDSQVTRSMVGRRLLPEADIVTIPFGTWYVAKSSNNPYKSQLQLYSEYLPIKPVPAARPTPHYKEIVISNMDKIMKKSIGYYEPLTRGMFD